MDRRRWLTMAVIALIFLSGCASSGAMPQQQALVQLHSQEKKSEVNQQLVALGATSPVKSSQDYQVGPEDLLEVEVYGQEDLQRTVRVNGKGEITMPLVGPVKVTGLTPQQVENRLQEVYGARFIKNPHVSVFVKEYRHQRVALTGAVKKPGFYEMIGPRTLLEMLAMGGGLDDKAGDFVHIIRTRGGKGEAKDLKQTDIPQPFTPNTETIVLDLKRLSKDGRLNLPLQQGDVVNVPYAGLAYVLGSVNKPGSVPVKNDLTVSQAIAVSGSPVSALAAPGNIKVLRLDENGQAVSLPVNLNRIVAKQEPDIPLKENDVVFVPESKIRKFLLDFRQLVGGGVSMGYAIAP